MMRTQTFVEVFLFRGSANFIINDVGDAPTLRLPPDTKDTPLRSHSTMFIGGPGTPILVNDYRHLAQFLTIPVHNGDVPLRSRGCVVGYLPGDNRSLRRGLGSVPALKACRINEAVTVLHIKKIARHLYHFARNAWCKWS
jgi:hypothetical protein